MRRAFTFVEAMIVVAIILVLAVILYPTLQRRGHEPGRAQCQSNLKQIGLSFFQYAQDTDERFPPVRASSSVGWADVLQPYVRSQSLFQCDKAPNGASNTFTTDYFFNRRLSRVALGQGKESAQTLLSGDGDDNAPTWNSWTKLPADALTNADSPSQRHLNGANYCFVDGHVKLLLPNLVSDASHKSPGATFAVR